MIWTVLLLSFMVVGNMRVPKNRQLISIYKNDNFVILEVIALP